MSACSMLGLEKVQNGLVKLTVTSVDSKKLSGVSSQSEYSLHKLGICFWTDIHSFQSVDFAKWFVRWLRPNC